MLQAVTEINGRLAADGHEFRSKVLLVRVHRRALFLRNRSANLIGRELDLRAEAVPAHFKIVREGESSTTQRAYCEQCRVPAV